MSQIARDLARKAAESLRGIEVIPYKSFNVEKYGALFAAHHFSFGKHYDPKRVRHGLLRVFDDGLFTSTEGIPCHPHKNIDIVSVVLRKNHHPLTNTLEGGAGLVHKDTGGHQDTIDPGNAQVMSIGHRGLSHAETITDNGNSSNVFQIWITQSVKKNDNSYTKVALPEAAEKCRMITLASGSPKNKNVAKLQSDSCISSAVLDPGRALSYTLGTKRFGYLVPASGTISVNGVTVNAHDAAQISNTETLDIRAIGSVPSEVVLVDTP